MMETPLVSQVADGASQTNAFYNMLCFTVGAGMLGLPHALLFSNGLYIVPTVFGGAVCYHTALLLHQVQLRSGVCSYQALGEACGGKGMKRLVATTLSINQAGIAVLYMITVCKNIEMLIGGNEDEPRWWLYPALTVVTFVSSCQGESIAHISGVSSLGLISVLAVGFLVVGAAAQMEPASVQCEAVSAPDALAGLGTAIFAYGGHPVYPDVQGSMQSQSEFGSVLTAAFAVMISLFVVVTSSAWYAFGCSVQGYLLDSLMDSWWRRAAVVGMTVHLVAAIPVVLLPMMRIVEGRILIRFELVRGGVVIITAVVAYMFPFFSDVLALMGGFTENLLVVFLPIVFHFITFGGRKGCWGLTVTATHAVILALAAAVLILGTLTSFKSMGAKYNIR